MKCPKCNTELCEYCGEEIINRSDHRCCSNAADV